MHKSVYVITLSALLLLSACQQDTVRVCFKNDCFTAELADTPEERRKGLMHREELPRHKGMLFVFNEPGKYSFWMKNTEIPLDIIWMDENGTVMDIYENATPCQRECPSLQPRARASYVLEVNAGVTDNIGLDIGQKAEIS